MIEQEAREHSSANPGYVDHGALREDLVRIGLPRVAMSATLASVSLVGTVLGGFHRGNLAFVTHKAPGRRVAWRQLLGVAAFHVAPFLVVRIDEIHAKNIALFLKKTTLPIYSALFNRELIRSNEQHPPFGIIIEQSVTV